MEEFAVSHLPSARRVDPESTASPALAALDPERPIVIYCSAGYRGATLARRLQDIGITLAATGQLHPVVAALLMLASSFTVATIANLRPRPGPTPPHKSEGKLTRDEIEFAVGEPRTARAN